MWTGSTIVMLPEPLNADHLEWGGGDHRTTGASGREKHLDDA